MLALAAPVNDIVTQVSPQPDTGLWLLVFDPQAAYESVIAHVETLPGSRHERHTMRAYLGSLADFAGFLGARVIHHPGGEDYSIDWAAMRMPTKPLVADYIAHCARRGLTASTITRYMAAVRHWLRALEEQPVFPRSGAEFTFILEAQRQFRLAASVKNPAPDRTSNRPALERHGTRLSLFQVNSLFASFAGELHTTTGQRDLALLYLGVTSGLRAAELARMSLGAITPGKDCFEVRVRGKRANHDPIGIDATAYDLIQSYVASWNERLSAGDPRRIAAATPLWQPLLRGDHLPTVGLHGYDPAAGLSARSILRLVDRRTARALGKGITAHDMRRTCAYLMRANGFEWDQIRAQLRHRSIGTTERYVGQEQDLSRALLSKRVRFTLPVAAAQPLPLEVQS